jgi:Tfp pilus assembly protein PilV
MDQLTMPRLAPPAKRSPKRGSAGFTLIEIALALVVLAFGLLALLAMQVEAIRGGKQGRHGTQAAVVARSQMEVLQRLAWNDPAMNATLGFTAPVQVQTVVQGPVNQIEQIYNVSWQITDVTANLKATDVLVTWTEERGLPRSYALASVRTNR